jgi:hypothetical protein
MIGPRPSRSAVWSWTAATISKCSARNASRSGLPWRTARWQKKISIFASAAKSFAFSSGYRDQR